MVAANRFTDSPLALPADVRLMRAATSALLWFGSAAVVALLAVVLARQPWFTLQAIRVEGDVGRSNEATLRANVATRLVGNFFTVDLDSARQAFESVPWVRRAMVSREWPNRLTVRLEEHVPAAVWQPEGSSDVATDTLVNTFGEVFQTNVGEVEDESLPTLAGPKGSSASMLDLLHALAPVYSRIDAGIDTLTLSARGSWRVLLSTGAQVEIGRGSKQELIARSERFVTSVGQVTERYQRPLRYADLRHREGYAVRLRGITTLTAETQKNTRK